MMVVMVRNGGDDSGGEGVVCLYNCTTTVDV